MMTVYRSTFVRVRAKREKIASVLIGFYTEGTDEDPCR
jgi:hypothetical protein